MTDVVGKLWGFCHTLRHDGIDYGDYIEQLTYLLFLKMIEEKGVKIPSEYAWAVLREKSGVELTDHYMKTLRGLGEQPGMLGAIYAGALSRFSNPVNLKRLVNLIDEIEWTALNVDVKAAAYEGLLEKSAAEGKKGAGQYFTPRILIQSIVRCVQPDPRKSKGFSIHDPAAGTGGFLVCAYEWLMEKTKGGLERSEAKRILTSTYSGTELVPRPRRLAFLMDAALPDGIKPPAAKTMRDVMATISRTPAISKLLEMGARSTRYLKMTPEIVSAHVSEESEFMLRYKITPFGSALLEHITSRMGMFSPEMLKAIKAFLGKDSTK